MKKQTEVHSLRMALAEWANRLDTPEVRQVAIPRTAKLECGAVDGNTMLATGNTQSWTTPGDFAIPARSAALLASASFKSRAW
jgi:hypothetical protein